MANVTEILIHTLDLSAPFLPKFLICAAGILNDLAQKENSNWRRVRLFLPFASFHSVKRLLCFRSWTALTHS